MNKPPRFLWGLRKKIMNVKELNLNFNHLTPLFKEAQGSFEFLFNQKYYLFSYLQAKSKIEGLCGPKGVLIMLYTLYFLVRLQIRQMEIRSNLCDICGAAL